MTSNTLIVARLDDGDRTSVAEIFAASDATELPQLLNVARRTLFSYRGLYFHLIETDGELATPLDQLRSHPLFEEVNGQLSRYIQPYAPDWQQPRDAMASAFYHWQRPAEQR